MRKVFLLVLALMPILSVQAQVKSFDDLYEVYSDAKGVEAKKVGKLMIKAARAMSKSGDGFPEGLTGVKAISVADLSKTDSRLKDRIEADLAKVIAACRYTIIADKTKDGTSFKAYSRPGASKDMVRDVIMVISAEGKYALMLMEGEFSRNEKFIAEMTKP